MKNLIFTIIVFASISYNSFCQKATRIKENFANLLTYTNSTDSVFYTSNYRLSDLKYIPLSLVEKYLDSKDSIYYKYKYFGEGDDKFVLINSNFTYYILNKFKYQDNYHVIIVKNKEEIPDSTVIKYMIFDSNGIKIHSELVHHEFPAEYTFFTKSICEFKNGLIKRGTYKRELGGYQNQNLLKPMTGKIKTTFILEKIDILNGTKFILEKKQFENDIMFFLKKPLKDGLYFY